MGVPSSLKHDLYEFAVELRKLAYTMPGGHEDALVRLSERMIRCASSAAGEQGAALPPTDVADALLDGRRDLTGS